MAQFKQYKLGFDRMFHVGDVTDQARDVQKAAVVAEGVETTEQIEFLTENGCDLLQGYYFSKPVDADALRQLLISWNSDDNDTRLRMAQ